MPLTVRIAAGGGIENRLPGGDAEKKYDAVKLECHSLLKALKKFRFWLFGRHFFVETDAQTLVWLLNQPPNDLPNAMMTRWLAYIRLFDFDVKHCARQIRGSWLGGNQIAHGGLSDILPGLVGSP